jgi:hypothetical protein
VRPDSRQLQNLAAQRLALLLLGALLCIWVGLSSAFAQDEAPNRRPVKSVGDQLIEVAPGAVLRALSSAPLQQAHPAVTQVLVIVHGRLRNADTYLRTGIKAVRASQRPPAEVLVIAPQFLAEVDAQAHALPADALRWSLEGWEGGAEARGPLPLGAFAAIDALLASLADRSRFPNLRRVVIAGHSGGAQLVQRYAIAAQADVLLRQKGIGLSFVVANPSSYAWFTAQRPKPDIAAGCAGFDRWKYGMDGRPAPLDRREPTDLERDYAGRDVIYLLGGADTDPMHPALDRSCAAEAQGAFRLERGLAFVSALRERQGASTHRMAVVPGVGHDGDRMYTSACGLSALFDLPGCAALPAR